LGTACRYVPVELAGAADSLGQFVEATARHAVGGRLLAEGAAPLLPS
jgi:hypothetical protein